MNLRFPATALLAGALLALALAVAPAAAADAESAAGTFRSGDVRFDVRSAVAFRGRSFTDGGDALIVAVAGVRLNAAAIADYLDRRRVIEQRVRDGATEVVFFEFAPDQRFRGMSYWFGPGNGCAYCTGPVASTVTLAAGTLSGTLKDAEADRTFDVRLVVPLLDDDHGAALPADGGAPGRAWLAWHAALAKADRAALLPLLSRSQRDYWATLDKEGKGGKYLHELAVAHPAKSARITGGYAQADKAVLQVAGEAASGKIVGEVLLVREDGAWRVDDEITESLRP